MAAARATRSRGPADPPLPLDLVIIDRKRKAEEIPLEIDEEKKRRLLIEGILAVEEEDDFLPKDETETDDSWTIMFNRLRRLCNPGHKFPRLDFKRDSDLIRWLNIQHLHQKDLTKRQRKLLNSLGYDWQRIMFKGTWDDNMEKLVSLKRKDGTFGISGLRVKDPRFYSWAVNARYRARWGGMTTKKINQLRNIGFLEETESSNDERSEAQPQSRRLKKELLEDEDDRVSADENHTEEDDSSEGSLPGSEEEEDRFDISDESEEEEEAIAILMMNHIRGAIPVC